MVAVLVMVVVVANSFFVGFCTIIFLIYFYCEGFWLRYFLERSSNIGFYGFYVGLRGRDDDGQSHRVNG